MIALNLVVLRAPDMAALAEFYSCLGLKFTKHVHGQGPEHYAAELPGLVFEIYPQSGEANTLVTRIGFAVPNLDDILGNIEGFGGKILSPAKPSPWGRRAVISDLVGHKVELVEQP